MPQPRSSLVSLSDTPWYHVVSRCVRRAYLCGEDAHSGRSFEHRRGWIVERLEQLAGVFAVDIAAYAVMSNHFRLVLRIDVERVQGWDADEVLRRWTKVFAGPLLVQRYLADRESLGAAETVPFQDIHPGDRGKARRLHGSGGSHLVFPGLMAHRRDLLTVRILVLVSGLLRRLEHPMAHVILAEVTASVSELKKNPMGTVAAGEGGAVAILNRNEPAFYCVPAAAYEALMDRLEDDELNRIADTRLGEKLHRVTLDDL